MDAEKQRRLAELQARYAATQAAAAPAPGSGDTLIDMGRNVFRGMQSGAQQIGGSVVSPETAAMFGRPNVPPPGPVGSGIGFRAGESVGRTAFSLPLGGPLAQLGMAATGGIVAEGTERMTGSPMAGNLAELGTNVLGMAAPAATRALFRGSAQAPMVAGEVADRAITGVNTGVGPATAGRTVPDTLQSLAEKVPGGRGVMQEFQQRVSDSFRASVDRFTGLLGRHASGADDLRAGIRIQRDIESSRTALNARMAAITARINVQPTAPVELSRTASILQQLGQRATGIDALDALATTPALRAAANVAGGGPLPPTSYEAALRLRSQIGQRLRNAGLVSDISTGEFKQLYGALTDDIGRTVEAQAGPQGMAAWQQSRRMWAREMRRFEDDLERIAGMTDPARAAELVQRSPRTLHIIRRQVSPETYDTLVAATFNDLGKAVNSAQNATGTAWSLESFLTRWNALGPESRTALLAGPRYEQARRGLNALARQASRAREINQRISNASGTSRGVADMATVGAPLAGLAAGKLWPIVAGAMAVGSSYGAARLMTNANFLNWMNQASRATAGQIGGAAVRLTSMMKETPMSQEEAQIAAEIALQIQNQLATERGQQ